MKTKDLAAMLEAKNLAAMLEAQEAEKNAARALFNLHLEPVQLLRKMTTNPIAMQFNCNAENFPGNLAEMIGWVRDAFYCLTDGEEIVVKKKAIARAGATDPDSPQLDHMTLILYDKDHDSIIVAKSGDWVAWDETNGYRVFTNEQVEANFDIADADDSNG